jgi:hypothetical protein
MMKKFAASAGTLVAAMAFAGIVVGQVPSSAATLQLSSPAAMQPHGAQVNDGCDPGPIPTGYKHLEQFNGSNACSQCNAHRLDAGTSVPTFCWRQNDSQAILWYGPHLG